jgi:hypothetical protein
LRATPVAALKRAVSKAAICGNRQPRAAVGLKRLRGVCLPVARSSSRSRRPAAPSRKSPTAGAVASGCSRPRCVTDDDINDQIIDEKVAA